MQNGVICCIMNMNKKETEVFAMKIMSFNVLCGGQGQKDWPARTPLVVRTIYKQDPDTFGVQEAHIGWMRVLKACLPAYDCVGVGRDDGGEKGEFSAVFFKRDKYDLLDSGSFWLSETPDKPGKGWDAACIRICSWAKLREKDSGKTFVHLNTHLDHIGAVAMQKGAELVAERGSAIGAGILYGRLQRDAAVRAVQGRARQRICGLPRRCAGRRQGSDVPQFRSAELQRRGDRLRVR